MKNIILFSILASIIFCQSSIATSKIVRTVENVQLPTYQEQNMYKQDLSAVEEYLFGKYYPNDTLSNRFNRIEKTLFNRNFNSLNPTQRINNIIANYKSQSYNNSYGNYNLAPTPAQRILNRFIGQPTGFTPPVMNLPYNGYGMPYGINKGFYNNRGSYTYNNEMPASAGFGVHILD